MNFFDHKNLGNHLLQLCPKVVKHPVYIYILLCLAWRWLLRAETCRCEVLKKTIKKVVLDYILSLYWIIGFQNYLTLSLYLHSRSLKSSQYQDYGVLWNRIVWWMDTNISEEPAPCIFRASLKPRRRKEQVSTQVLYHLPNCTVL